MARQVNLLLKVCLDVICVSIVGFPLLIFLISGKPYKRGFFCDDESIRYPYLNDTITNGALYAIGITSPILVIIIGEFLIKKKKLSCCHDVEVTLYRCNVPMIIFMWYKKIGVFLFGACVSQILTDIGKYQIGRLRPHFIAACKPVYNPSLCNPNNYTYITDFECDNKDLFMVREARLSFPSGHASFSAYAMVYIIIYLHYRMMCKINYLLKPFLQVLALLTTWSISLTRISDYKHHWSDVLLGWILGTLVALIVTAYISDLPPKHHVKMNYQLSLSSPNSTQLTNYNSCENDMEEGCTQSTK